MCLHLAIVCACFGINGNTTQISYPRVLFPGVHYSQALWKLFTLERSCPDSHLQLYFSPTFLHPALHGVVSCSAHTAPHIHLLHVDSPGRPAASASTRLGPEAEFLPDLYTSTVTCLKQRSSPSRSSHFRLHPHSVLLTAPGREEQPRLSGNQAEWLHARWH